MAQQKPTDEHLTKLFRDRLEAELAGKKPTPDKEAAGAQTRAYNEFKKQYMPKPLSFYEKICQTAESILPFKPDPKKLPQIQETIKICHLNTTPTGVYSASLFIPLVIVLAALFLFFVIPVILGLPPNIFFVFFAIIGAAGIMIPLQNLPEMLSNSWRLKASNQMVLAVFYMVTYMRHTSNLELAINFASEHLGPPLSLDLRKIVWDVETEKYDSIKESLDAYLDTWRKYNMEFVESVHLIQSSLYESSNDRRLGSLDKSLNVMLEGTYEKMLHYAHGLKGPLTTLNMLGVVLPILTLVILPLVVSMMGGISWYHLFALYNVGLPIIVYYLGKNILSTRPGGSGDTDITEKNPELKKYKKIAIKFGTSETYVKPSYFAAIIALVFVVIGFIPLLWHISPFPDYGVTGGFATRDFQILDLDTADPDLVIKFYMLGYRDEIIDGEPTGEIVGPFGLGAILFSLLIPLGIGYSLGLYYKLRSKNVIAIRRQAKALELEFSSALFQLGNRIGDGVPAETAFGRVAGEMEDTISGKFFTLVHTNVTRLGMSVEDAIFNREKGALKYYPSDLIESSMKVLVESSRKGPLVASQALINVAEYIKQMHRVDERLKDLMGDVISSMKSQVSFLTPVISAIVIGITSMITKILGFLGDKMGRIEGGDQGLGNVAGFFGTGIPTYHFQIVVGLYVVQLAFILTIIANGIENGPDKVGEEYNLGQALTKSVLLYTAIAGIVIILFNIVAGSILKVV